MGIIAVGDMQQRTNLWGTPLQEYSKRLLLLGSGELGKEVAIEAMRLGIEVIAVDTYPHAPAMQVAHRSHLVDMLDGQKLRYIIEKEHPTWIVPEIEAIATEMLLTLEQEGWQVIPTADPADHGSGRDSAVSSGGVRATHFSLLLCRNDRGFPSRHRNNRPALCGEADHEFFGERAKCGAYPGGGAARLAIRPTGRTYLYGPGDCGRLCTL